MFTSIASNVSINGKYLALEWMELDEMMNVFWKLIDSSLKFNLKSKKHVK